MVSIIKTSTYLLDLIATDSISTAIFCLTNLFWSTKLWCKPYFGDDKCKNSDDKVKTGMLYFVKFNL